jgi:hypothetical protein
LEFAIPLHGAVKCFGSSAFSISENWSWDPETLSDLDFILCKIIAAIVVFSQ